MNFDEAMTIVTTAADSDPRLPDALQFLAPPCADVSKAGMPRPISAAAETSC